MSGLHPLPAPMDVAVWLGRLYQTFGDVCCLHLQGYHISQRKRLHTPGNVIFFPPPSEMFLLVTSANFGA
jgi:hypothetical protein